MSEKRPGKGYQFQLFGGPLVTGPDGPVKLSPYQALLLVLVCGHETRPLSRRQAIWLLWEEDDTPDARHKLRQVLYGIKRRLGFQPVGTGDEDSLPYDGDVLPSDLEGFRAALRSGDLAPATVMHQKGFLSKLSAAPTEELEDWLEAKRVSVRRDLWTRAADLWDQAYRDTSWDMCREAAETLYSLAPESEAALQKVIEARAMTGHPEAAEAAYAMFLEEHASAHVPSEATTQLVERVRALTRSATPPRLSEPVGYRTPFVGRKKALRWGRDFVATIAGGDSAFAMISGEAGLGKTRLLEEITTRAHLEGIRCLSAQLVESERSLPLNPLIDAFAHPDVAVAIQDLGDPWRAVLASVLPPGVVPDQGPPLPEIGADRASRRLFDSIALLFRRLASDGPTILFLDNIQWIDDTTLAALHFVQRRWREGGLGILATVRTPASGRADPSLAQVPEMFTTRIPLSGLTNDEAAELVAGVLESELEGAAMVELVAMGGGNPFYLTELARAHREGRLALPTQVHDRVPIPISLKELVEARVSPLSPSAMLAAEVLSVWARPTHLRALGKVSGQSDAEVVSSVEQLEESGIARVEDGRASVAHDLFRTALYERISSSRRAFSHRAIAEHLVADEPGTPPGELAFHFARAGEALPAAKFARMAAEEAAAKGAFPEACGFLQIAIDNDPDDETKALLTADLGRMLSKGREISRAAPVLETAGLRLRRLGLIERAREMEVLRVEALAELGVASNSELLGRLDGILSEAKGQEDWTGVATAVEALLRILHRTGDVKRMRDALEQAEHCILQGNDRERCLGNSLLALGCLYGDPSRALEAGREAVRLCEAGGYPDLLLTAQNRLIVVMLLRGMLNLPEGQRLIRHAAEAAEKSGDRIQRFVLEGNQGLFFLDAGEPELARSAMERSAGILRGAEAGTYSFLLVQNLGELAVQEEDYSLAQEYFTQAEELLGHTTASHGRWLVNAGLGICALERGRLSEARVREADSGPTHGPWHFDPTLIIDFRIRYLLRRGEVETALTMVESHLPEVRDHLTQAWLKLKTMEGRLARRLKRGDTALRLAEAIGVAEELRLSTRAGILRELATDR